MNDVSFTVERGEIFGLLGPNGAGKTTTIRMLLHILEPDGGTVLYDGKPFTEETRNLLGYLPEERGLYKKSKLIDTLALLRRTARACTRPHARERAQYWLKRLELAGQENRKVEEFSKGNQQKIQFIASVIHDPALIILDEPFSGLDPVNQLLFKDILQEMKQEGKAIILSTHQMDQAERLSDTLCLINRGTVVLGGSVRDVKKRYGKNSLHVEFDGDGAFMEDLPGVQRALLYERSAELELEPGTTTRAVIEAINPRVELRKVELLEPSLHSIFLQVVGDPPPGRGRWRNEQSICCCPLGVPREGQEQGIPHRSLPHTDHHGRDGRPAERSSRARRMKRAGPSQSSRRNNAIAPASPSGCRIRYKLRNGQTELRRPPADRSAADEHDAALESRCRCSALEQGELEGFVVLTPGDQLVEYRSKVVGDFGSADAHRRDPARDPRRAARARTRSGPGHPQASSMCR